MGRVDPEQCVDAQTLVIAAGGTGGHMFPAQALAQEMLRRGWRVALSTDDRGLRYAHSFPIDVERRAMRSASVARGGVAQKIAAPFKIAEGARDATAWFREARPAAVAGFGGYPSLPAIVAAWRLGLPRVLHEQNAVLGRVNRLFARRVDAVACGSWPVTNAPAGAPLLHVGNPIRDAAAAFAGARYRAPEPDGRLRLLVFGGSQGARHLSDRAPSAAAKLPEALRRRLTVAHQAREEDVERVDAAYVAMGVAADVATFFDDLPARMGEAHLVICRAGASTLAELTAIGRPSILAPLPGATADHQTANAGALVDAGAALAMADAEMSADALAGALEALLTAPNRLDGMAAAARALGRPDAASTLGDLIEELAAGRRLRQ